MPASPAQARSVVGSVASVVVVAYGVVCAVASAVVASEVDTHRKDPDATSRAKISMRTTQGPMVVTVVFVWIAMVVVTVVVVVVVLVVVVVTVTLNPSQASKSWFAT